MEKNRLQVRLKKRNVVNNDLLVQFGNEIKFNIPRKNGVGSPQFNKWKKEEESVIINKLNNQFFKNEFSTHDQRESVLKAKVNELKKNPQQFKSTQEKKQYFLNLKKELQNQFYNEEAGKGIDNRVKMLKSTINKMEIEFTNNWKKKIMDIIEDKDEDEYESEESEQIPSDDDETDERMDNIARSVKCWIMPDNIELSTYVNLPVRIYDEISVPVLERNELNNEHLSVKTTNGSSQGKSTGSSSALKETKKQKSDLDTF